MNIVLLFFLVMSASSGILCQPSVADGVEGEHTSGTVGTGRLDQGKNIFERYLAWIIQF